MGAASGSVQTATAPQSQGKGGAPTGGYGAPTSGGKVGQLTSQQQSSNQPAIFDSTNSTTTQDMMGGQGNGMSVGQTIGMGQPSLPTGNQQGWQYGQQGKVGNKITYPSTSGQQQFGQPMQNAYPNTIGQSQQSNQMNASGKGKGV
jgi:hypothetical protein